MAEKSRGKHQRTGENRTSLIKMFLQEAQLAHHGSFQWDPPFVVFNLTNYIKWPAQQTEPTRIIIIHPLDSISEENF